MVNQSASTIELTPLSTNIGNEAEEKHKKTVAEAEQIFNTTPEAYDLLPKKEKIESFKLEAGNAISDYNKAIRSGGEKAEKFSKFAHQVESLCKVFYRFTNYGLTDNDIRNITAFFEDYMSKRKFEYDPGAKDEIITNLSFEYRNACVGLCYFKDLLNETDPAQRNARVERKNGNGREEPLVEKEQPRGNRQHKRNRIDIPTVRSFRLTPSDFEVD